jgi:hypothetical protein
MPLAGEHLQLVGLARFDELVDQLGRVAVHAPTNGQRVSESSVAARTANFWWRSYQKCTFSSLRPWIISSRLSLQPSKIECASAHTQGVNRGRQDDVARPEKVEREGKGYSSGNPETMLSTDPLE